MISKEYAMAYKEVITILSYVPEIDIEKIPKEKIEFYRSNMDNEYEYKIDETKPFEYQGMSNITRAVLANLFKNYWATQYQKERIEAKEKYDLQKIEEEKKQKYNPDNIFKNNQADNAFASNLPTEIKKKSFLWKVVDFFKSIIRKK